LKATRKSLKRQEATYARGQGFLDSQNWPGAVGAFRRVLELNPNHQDAAARLIEVEERRVESVGSEGTSPAGPEFNWLSNAVVAFIAGGICAGLIYQLAKNLLISLGPPLRILAVVFLLLILVPVFFYAQWLLITWRREASDSKM
jgi:hypothetical protein